MTQIKESDWKIFKQVHEEALERYFLRALVEVEKVVRGPGESHRERFWEVVEIGEKKRKEVQRVFDDFRRSTALLQLAVMRRMELVTDEEMGRFGEETRKFVAGVLAIGS